nr:DNA-directed RNA polymerase III subunit RPC3 isoform X2 [Parasteatoda tepidariorum]
MVQSSLLNLIQMNFCEFKLNDMGLAPIVEYSVSPYKVLSVLHYERYAYCAQLLYGDPADLLVEEILNHGHLTMSEAIRKVIERLQEAKDATGVDYSSEKICDKFRLLITNQYLIRCPYAETVDFERVPNLCLADKDKFVVPEIKLHLLETNSCEEPENKKQKIEYPDAGINWKINFDRFKEYFRNEAIITACANVHGEKASEIIKAILLLSDQKYNALSATSGAVQYYDILKLLESSSFTSKDLDAYLSIVCEDEYGFVSKADERGNGMYVVNISKILKKLVESIITSVVQDRFGSKCARIFRILLDKKVLEPKRIEELAMLPPKDTKDYIAKMFEESFILSQEVSKGSDILYGVTFYLLSIDIVQVCRMVLERCYKSVFNLISCNEIQYQENKRLLEKNQRIDAIVASLKQSGAEEEQIVEVQNIISEPERILITKVENVTKKIHSSQIQIAEMISILTMWLEYNSFK